MKVPGSFSDPIDPSILCACFEEKLTALRKLLSITEGLALGLDNRDMSKVRGLLEDRQDLIHRIKTIDRRIEEVTSGISLNEKGCPDEIRDQIRILLKTIEGTLEKAIELDQKCAASILSEQNEIKSEMVKARLGLKTVRSYTGRVVHQPKFLDVRR